MGRLSDRLQPVLQRAQWKAVDEPDSRLESPNRAKGIRRQIEGARSNAEAIRSSEQIAELVLPRLALLIFEDGSLRPALASVLRCDSRCRSRRPLIESILCIASLATDRARIYCPTGHRVLVLPRPFFLISQDAEKESA